MQESACVSSRISLLGKQTSIRVSSVLNNDTNNFGKKHLIDANGETCWHSDKGSQQWVAVKFDNCVDINELLIQFQGGFASTKMTLLFDESYDQLNKIVLYPEDNNKEQLFKLPQVVRTNYLRLLFELNVDLFGRIIIYKLDIFSKA